MPDTRGTEPPEIQISVPDDLDIQLRFDLSPLAMIAAHELREPVQAIASFLAVVLDRRTGPLTDLQEDFLSSARVAASRAGRLIDDLHLVLNHSEVIDIRKRKLSLAERLQACCDELSLMADDRDVEIRNNLAIVGNCQVLGDADRIDQILLNILENAVEYAPARSTVEATLTRHSEHYWRVDVENAIDGLVIDDPDDWLTPYNRGGRSGGRGLGLGLTVVQMLLRAHDGHIDIGVRGNVVRASLLFPISEKLDA